VIIDCCAKQATTICINSEEMLMAGKQPRAEMKMNLAAIRKAA